MLSQAISTPTNWPNVIWIYGVLAGQPWLLFNLNEDPYELRNLAHNRAFAHERQRLQERLAAWITETGDHFALPEI